MTNDKCTEKFVAIDFETADYKRDSACAVGLVRVEGGEKVASAAYLIRPPRKRFYFTHIHHLTWEMVAGEPDFRGRWAEIAEMIDGVDFLAAHNASFDKSVLNGCCRAYAIPEPQIDFVCTLKLARQKLELANYRLDSVCRHFGIKLDHHEALSDAAACAEIVLKLQD